MNELEHYLTFIGYLKKKIWNESVSDDELNDFAIRISKDIDELYVRGEKSVSLERLYEEVRLFQSELLIQHIYE